MGDVGRSGNVFVRLFRSFMMCFSKGLFCFFGEEADQRSTRTRRLQEEKRRGSERGAINAKKWLEVLECHNEDVVETDAAVLGREASAGSDSGRFERGEEGITQSQECTVHDDAQGQHWILMRQSIVGGSSCVWTC